MIPSQVVPGSFEGGTTPEVLEGVFATWHS